VLTVVPVALVTLSRIAASNTGSRVRILIIANLYPDTNQPTFGTFVAARAAALRRAGATVGVVAIRGVRVHRRIARKYLRLAAEAFSFAVRGLARRRPPSVVEAHIAYPTALIAWPVARICRSRLVLFVHGGDVLEVGRRSTAHHRLARFIFSRADLLVANSAFTRLALHDGYGVPFDRIVIWSPGIDTDLFKPISGVVRQARQVLFVGRLDPEKGVDVLIDAIAQLPDLELTLDVIGDGPERAMLEKAAARANVAVRFRGGLTPPEVASAMAQAGVLVVPSVYAEPLGLVALEGMATGAFVIASETGGLRESITAGESGWLVPAGDSVRFAKAIREAVSLGLNPSDARARDIRTAAIDRAASHDVYEVAKASLHHYQQIANAS
jgi:glycosyltransferase involved in cell wall biosynthesis